MQVPPESITFQHYNGTISLFSPALPQVYDPQLRHVPGHITLVTAEEYKAINRPAIDTVISTLPVDHVYLVGEGHSRNGEIKWTSVVWNAGDKWRARLGLDRRFFHVTMSARDDHSIHKGIQSVINRLGIDGLVDNLENLSAGGMHEVFLSSQNDGPPSFQIELSTRMVVRYPQFYHGYQCLARCSLHPKTRMLALAQALNLNPALLRQAIEDLQQPLECSFGPTITEPEWEQIPSELVAHLAKPWPDALYGKETEDLHRVLWLNTTPPRETIKYLGYELPRNFSWVYPLRIAGMSTPRNEEDVDCLERMGVTDLLSLNKEGPLPRQWVKLKGIKHHQVMLENYAAPTCAEMDVIWDRVSAGGVWVIHCGGGVGRAGTVIACLMTMLGRGDGQSKEWGDEDGKRLNMPILGSDEAIKLLRQARPKSIESDPQAAFVSKWVSHRWKILSAPPPIIEPSDPLDRNCFQGERINADDLDNVILFLIGKPGSGKSFFSEMITKRRIDNKPTIIISQDDCGSKEMCEKEISRDWPPSTLLIFDRCNPTSKDRKAWLKKVHPDRRPIAVYFDFDKKLCRQRIDQRIGHPTIRAGRGVKALEEMDKKMEPPSLDEGFSTIIRIDSFPAAKELAVKWLTSPIPLRKFPRTPHLIDTGASTEDDLLCDIFPASGRLEGKLTIEEKIDGANLGISLDSDLKLVIQNRSHLIHGSLSGQFRGLDTWLQEHSIALYEILHQDPAFPDRHILYGEWCHAKHSIRYTRLDDRFVAFDLYDRVTDTYCARRVLTRLLKRSGIAQVPFIKYCDTITREEVLQIVQGRSAFVERPSDSDEEWGKGKGFRVKGDVVSSPSGERKAGDEPIVTSPQIRDVDTEVDRTGEEKKDQKDRRAQSEAAKRLDVDGRMEGIYIRFEDPKRLICEARGKVVRSDFLGVDAKHWSRAKPVWNKTKAELGESPIRREDEWVTGSMSNLGTTSTSRAGGRGRMDREHDEGIVEEMGALDLWERRVEGIITAGGEDGGGEAGEGEK